MSLIPNPLNKFSSFNYIWFMDIATKEEQRTAGYKRKQGRIIRSGGIANTAGANLQTLDERNIGVKGEYFIDNVRTQAYVSPNPYSGIANVTKVEFEVIEPYSIGLFLQTLELAAREAGYKNYLDSPFVLGVEFTGYDTNGTLSTIEKRVLLLKLTKITFNVTAAGSVYQVQAIPWNHQALLDQVDSIPVNISIKGDTVEEILTSLAADGVTDVIETQNTPAGPQQVRTGSEITGTRSLIKELNDFEKREIEAKSGSENITPTEYEILFPVDPSQLGTKNIFSTQKIAENFTDLGNQDLGLPDFVYDATNSLYTRGNLTISENGRVYQFPQGTKIEKIIEEVILTSEWARDIVNLKPDPDGYVEWFRILTFVDILDGERDRFGALPKKYTYVVYPYKIHVSTLTTTAQRVNYNTNIRNAVKGYNYTYTGENIDILDFNIDIDYAWIQAIANLPQTSAALKDRSNTILIREETQTLVNLGVDRGLAEAAVRNEVQSYQGPTTNTFSNSIGANIDDEQTRVARAFNSAIVNSNADLIKLKMTIWGDPYYLADTDFGGYIANRGRLNQSVDGAMDHIRSEVDVLLKFAGAVDYKDSLLMPNTARQFSGVYKVVRVNSMFESGMFKQELELIRRRNPDEASLDNVFSAIDARAENREPFLRPATSGINAGDLALFLKQAEEAEQLFNIFGQLRLQDLASALNVTPFGLVSRLSGFTQLFDQARQIRSAIGNLGSLASNINLSGINSQSLQQLTQQLSGAQDFFNQAFTQIDVSSITQVLNQSLSNIPAQLQNLPNQLVSGSIGRLAGQIQETVSSISQITPQGIVGANVPIAPPLEGLSSIIRPQPRPQNLNPLSTRLIDTPAGPKRVVVGTASRNSTPPTSVRRIGPQ